MTNFMIKHLLIIVTLLASSSVFATSSIKLTPTNTNYSSFSFPAGTQYAATNLIVATLLFKRNNNAPNVTIKGEFIYDLKSGRKFVGFSRQSPLLSDEEIAVLGEEDKIKSILTPFYRLNKNQLIHIHNFVKLHYADGITDQKILKAAIVTNVVTGDTSYTDINNSYLVVKLFQKAYMDDSSHFNKIREFIDELS